MTAARPGEVRPTVRTTRKHSWYGCFLHCALLGSRRACEGGRRPPPSSGVRGRRRLTVGSPAALVVSRERSGGLGRVRRAELGRAPEGSRPKAEGGGALAESAASTAASGAPRRLAGAVGLGPPGGALPGACPRRSRWRRRDAHHRHQQRWPRPASSPCSQTAWPRARAPSSHGIHRLHGQRRDPVRILGDGECAESDDGVNSVSI